MYSWQQQTVFRCGTFVLHAVDKLEPGVGLHGEKCGIGTILIAKLQGQDWKQIAKTLKDVGAPTTAKEIGLKPEILAKALTIAQS